jgi:hypothetical protein
VGPPVYRPNLALESRPGPSAYRPLSGERPAPKRQFTQGALQRMNATAGRGIGASQPAAQPQTQQRLQGPPVYRPNLALEARPAPSAYRPSSSETPARNKQLAGGTLQRMNATAGRGTGASQPAAQPQTQQRLQGPPVYRPQNPAAAQRKTTDPPAYRPNLGLKPRPAPPVYRPGSGSSALLLKATASKLAAPKMPDSGMRGSKKFDVIQRSIEEEYNQLIAGLKQFKGQPIQPPPTPPLAKITVPGPPPELIEELLRQPGAVVRRAALGQPPPELIEELLRQPGAVVKGAGRMPTQPNVIPPPPTPPLAQPPPTPPKVRRPTIVEEEEEEEGEEEEVSVEEISEEELRQLAIEAPQTPILYGYEVEQGILGATPGESTSVFGAGGLAGNLASFAWSSNPSNVPSAIGLEGGGVTSVAGGVGDVYGIVNASKTIHEARKVLSQYDLSPEKKQEIAEWLLANRKVKSAGADLASMLVDAPGQTIDIIGDIANVAGASWASTVGAVGTGLSLPVSTFVAVRGARSAHLAGKYKKEVEKALKSQDLQKLGKQSELYKAAAYMRSQMWKRQARHAIGATGAAIGTVGSAFAIAGTAVASAALFATPVGWALGAAGAVVALGVGGYKAYRFVRKRRRKKAGRGLGGKRSHVAAVLLQALQSNDPAEYQAAVAIVEARDLEPKVLLADKVKGRELLEEKLKSW